MRKGSERPSKIVLDDIENEEDVESPKMREKLIRTFTQKILNLGSRHTKYRMVGTVLHYDSLLINEFNKPREGWHWEFYKAIGDNNEPLWPEWWPIDRLEERRKEIGVIPFEQEFQQNPLDPSTQIIRPKAFYDNLDIGRCDCYAFIDLAISEKQTADYTAIVTIAKDRYDSKMFIVDPRRLRGDVTAQLNLVFELYNQYHWKAFGVESVAYQKAFAQILRLECNRRGIFIPAVEVEIDRDKVRRVLEISPYIDNGQVMFNNSFQEFNSECFQFPKAAHDDYVDSLAGAIKIAISYGGSGQVMTGGGISYPKTY